MGREGVENVPEEQPDDVGIGVDLGSSGALRRDVARGGIWSLGGTGAALIASLVATPFTLRLLGPATYGLWALLQATLSYLVLADLGMASASTKFAGDRRARSDDHGEATVIWTSLALTTAITCAAVLALSLAAPFILSTVLHVPPQLRRPGILGVRILGVAVVARSVAGTINTPQVVRLRWRGLTLATSGPVILQTVAAPLALLVAEGGVVTMAIVSATAAVAAAAGNGFLAARLQPSMVRPHLDPTVLRNLVRYGGALSLSGFALIPLVTADRLFVAHFRSTTAVAHYAVAMSLGAMLTAIPTAATAPLFPALVRLLSTGPPEELRRFYRQALEGIFLAMTPSTIVLAFLAGPFLRLWAGPEYARYSTLPFFILLAGLWFNALAFAPYNYLLATGRTSLIARIHLFELIPYLAIAALLTSLFGIVGAAIAWTSRVVLDSVLFFSVARRDAGLPWLPTPDRKSRTLAAAAGLALAVSVLSVLVSGLFARAACSGVLLLAYALSMRNLVLTADERQGVETLAKQLVPVRRRHRPAT